MDPQFFQYQPYDPSLETRLKGLWGSVGYNPLGGGHYQSLYYNPQGQEAATDPGTANYTNVVSLYKAMRAGLIPWVSEALRARVYRDHGQALPQAGYGLAADQAFTAPGTVGGPRPNPDIGFVRSPHPQPANPDIGFVRSPAPTGHLRNAVLGMLGH